MNSEPILIVTAAVAVLTYGLKAWLGPEFDVPVEVQNAFAIVILFVGAIIARAFVFNRKSAAVLEAKVPDGYVKAEGE